MKKRNEFNFVFLISLLLITIGGHAQGYQRAGGPANRGGMVIGNVYDEESRHPIAYANIVLYNADDSTQIAGAITNEEGEFELTKIRPGSYYVDVHFIGYNTKRIENVSIGRGQRVADLGEIFISPGIMNTESIEVVGERPAISYQIDKKVIDVDRFNTSVSGNAIDILENIPSVSVDIDGNVSLRGSENFTLLIDGRPSILDPSDALEQIPSSTIEEIEIITNPSVKFDPEGTSGIMNIILKKDQRAGSSGMVNLNGGLNDKYGGEVLLDYQKEKYHAVLGLDYNKRYMTGIGESENITTKNDTTSTILSKENSIRGRVSRGIRAELEYKLNPQNIINFGGRYGARESENSADADFTKWIDPQDKTDYRSDEERDRSGSRYSLFSSYRHYFKSKGHELYSEVYYRHGDGDELTENEQFSSDGTLVSGRKTIEKGPSSGLRAKVDYTLPLNKDDKFEAGYQFDSNISEDNTELHEFNDTTGQYINLLKYSNSTEYEKNINAIYALYRATFNKFGYQIGLRSEYTNRIINYDAVAKKFKLNRWDYFPTLHMSYEFLQNQRLMASYARRIRRPRGWQLEPFETWTDAHTVRRGNPDIKPEYIDSYELGYQTNIGKSLFSTEVYYRVINDKIEHIHSVYDLGISLHTFENVGKEYSLGSEFLLNFDPLKIWSVNLMANLYQYKIEGSLNGQDYSNDSFNWRTRLSNSIRITPSTQLQIDGMYNSPSVSAQGKREGNYSVNLALKQELFKKLLTATLQVRDVFDTSHREMTSKGENFYTYRYREREAPIVMLNLRLMINNYKQERRERNGEEMNGEEGEGEF